MKLNKLIICSVISLSFSSATAVFADTPSTQTLIEQNNSEMFYQAVETDVENEYLLQPITNKGRSLSTGTISQFLTEYEEGASTDEAIHTFDNKGVFSNHTKATVTIIRNPNLNLRVTLIDRETGREVDSTVFNKTTGSFTFYLNSSLTQYKIYIGNKSNVSGQIQYSIKTS
ncbi:MAG TPA: hypothetical protein GX497_11180 [Bacillus bacterium]|nr:hypothetical protein [Bacillus sp. (in: firmicutes)]